MAAALAAFTVACAAAAEGATAAGEGATGYASLSRFPAVTIAILPRGTEPIDLEGVEGLSPGVMSAGLATVTPSQTYADISAGNRVFTSLYPGDDLNVYPGFGRTVPGWDRIVDRADGAPAEIVPGLLASTLQDDGVRIAAQSDVGSPALIAANRDGAVDRVAAGACVAERCPGVTVVDAAVSQLPAIVSRLRDEDMLLAFERAPPEERDVLAAGAAGSGFDGNLTSDTTRTPGFVLATDVAPTVLDRYGVAIPHEMNGNPIETEGDVDAAAVQDRADRMKVVTKRRGAVVLRNAMAWLLLAGLVAALSRGRLGRPAMAVFGLSIVYLPALLLVGAALRPEEVLTERLIVGIGAPVLAALTFFALRGWWALAAACGVTLGAYALDMVAGSPLTAQSLLGPNPGLGVRFFGIGNELESSLAVVIPVGTGAALTAARAAGREVTPRAAVIAFFAVGAAAAIVFASGRFGADVGAAIVFPAGAAVSALAVPGVLGSNRRLVALVVLAPLAGLALLLLLDLLLGGDAHLSRSVLDAGGAGELGEVFERRLRLSASSFSRAFGQALFWFAIAAILTAIVFRKRILEWLAPAPFARAGFAGAAAAILLGVVANDSGATFLIIGSIGLIGCLAFAWSQARKPAQIALTGGDEPH